MMGRPDPLNHNGNAPPRWRLMRAAEVSAVAALGNAIHTHHPEQESTFRRKFDLFPLGAHVLDASGTIGGYALFHPWLHGNPPALDTWLPALPAHPDCLHLHDAALHPHHRGRGHVRALMPILHATAAAYHLPCITLVAVDGADAVWRSLGFTAAHTPHHANIVRSYGAGAVFMAMPAT